MANKIISKSTKGIFIEPRNTNLSPLKDSFGRIVNNLRISVTDRCNFRCRYCMPEEGMQWMAKGELLTFEEITRLTKIFAALGVSKIRLTGGEPLMRKDLHVLVDLVSSVPGIKDLAMTTNGFFLADQAEALIASGLSRINVSLDSLDPAKFTAITRRDHYHKVWEGIETVERLGVRPIKLNVVLVRGINDGEIPKFAQLVRSRPFIVRFIEFMPIGNDDGWSPDKVVSGKEVITAMENAIGKKMIPVERRGEQPADRFCFEDEIGEIGLISSVSEPFCTHCNRVRITSDGKLRTCLFSLTETDLKVLLRNGAADAAIRDQIVAAVLGKEEGHLIGRSDFVRPARSMSQIGG
jgi:cyclic pyranopterin phosphate synthase